MPRRVTPEPITGEQVAQRTVLTTGANSGIGLATALEVARRGYRSVGSVRSAAKAAVVHSAAAEAGVEVETVLLDVVDPAGCEQVVADLSPIYGLVNNAGVGGVGAVEEVADDEARGLLEVMLLAPARLARLALPGMRSVGAGRIVNVSSIYGRVTTPLTGWYQAAKHGLEAVSDALRNEVAGDGIAVVLVEPGAFRTGIWAGVRTDVAARPDSRYAVAYRRSQSVQQGWEPLMGTPQTVARVIGDVLDTRSPRARYLVGLDARGLALVDPFTATAVKDFVTRRVLGL
jgi:NAD(P)-dependent dehydrogenase (short-subunit alcohol dehydrogenase family)